MNIMRKDPTSHKRQIHEVEDVEVRRPASRVCTSPARSASTLKARSPQDDVCSNLEQSMYRLLIMLLNKARPVIPTPNIESAVWSDESEEGDSQISYKDFMSSRVDFDPDETMASQQTAATELTQPSPSTISRVGALKPATFRYPADNDSMPKRYAYDYGLHISKFRPIRQTYLSPNCEPRGMKVRIHRYPQIPTLAQMISLHYPNSFQHQFCARQPIRRVRLHLRRFHLPPQAL